MANWLAIALGGGLGAVSRYALSLRIYAWLGRDFPWGTLGVNLLGSFLMGFLAILLTSRLQVEEPLRNGLLIGYLGALTTYSTFAMDKLQLLQQGAYLKAGSYMLASTLVCLAAVIFGTWLAKQIP
jgi:CrcB protein